MLHRRFWSSAVSIVAVLCAGLFVGGCDDDDSPTGVSPAAGTVKLQFHHNVSGEELVFNSMQYTNAAGEDYSVVRLNYLISNVEVVGSNGTSYLVPGPFFVDAEADSTLEHLLTAVPPGTYESVRFTFGLDENVNNTAQFINEPWHAKMSWPDPLGGGYHYMIFDGFVDTGMPAPDDRRSYNTHHGRTQKDPHYFQVSLDVTSFTVDGNTTCVTLHFDLNEWYKTPHVYSFPNPAFIMDKPDVQEVLKDNGASVFTAPVATP